MLIYILLAITSCIVSLTYLKKYHWEGESLDGKRTMLTLSVTLYGLVFPLGVVVILLYGIIYVLTVLTDELIKLLDKI